MGTGKKYRIAAVCGAGLATSTWIAIKLGNELRKRGIDAEIVEMKIVDLSLSAGDYDLIVSASKLSDIYDAPVVVATSLITGIGLDKTVDRIVNILKAGDEAS